MKPTPAQFHKAWWDLHQHGIFALIDERVKAAKGFPDSMFFRCLDVFVAKVHPKTRIVLDDDRKKGDVEVWLECGPWMVYKKGTPEQENFPEGLASHDYRLDCGAPTYEEAIVKMRDNVWKYYGKKAKPRVIRRGK